MEKSIILAIETSCDETAAAVVCDGKTVLSDIISSQAELHKKFGGVVPEVASRMHIENISAVVDSAVEESGVSFNEITHMAVTYAPGLIGALLVGVSYAKSLSFSQKKPLIPVHHIEGHIAANYLAHPHLKPPFICLVASGGHSNIVMVKDYTKFEILAKTRDDAAGEAFDKISRVLGLGYPGGPLIEKCAKNGDEGHIKFPKVKFDDDSLDFSFSGVKTAVINHVHRLTQNGGHINKEDIAASFQAAVVDVLAERLILASDMTGINKLALAGGVSANGRLRERLTEVCKQKGKELYYPPLSLCTDNAAMIGCAAYYRMREGCFADNFLNAKASLPL